jgi:hypothetical protein
MTGPIMTEQERMQITLDGISKRIIFANARRICKRQYQRKPNWSLAMEIFGLGSTYACALCAQIGVDPDGRDMTAPQAKRIER